MRKTLRTNLSWIFYWWSVISHSDITNLQPRPALRGHMVRAEWSDSTGYGIWSGRLRWSWAHIISPLGHWAKTLSLTALGTLADPRVPIRKQEVETRDAYKPGKENAATLGSGLSRPQSWTALTFPRPNTARLCVTPGLWGPLATRQDPRTTDAGRWEVQQQWNTWCGRHLHNPEKLHRWQCSRQISQLFY